MQQFLGMIEKSLRPVKSRISALIQRGIVKRVDDSQPNQTLQLAMGEEDVQDDVLRIQNYGFSSVPPEQSEALILAPHGERDFSIAVSVDAPQNRIKDLKPGDVALYHQSGSAIILSSNGKIQIKSGGVELISTLCTLVDRLTNTKFTGQVVVAPPLETSLSGVKEHLNALKY